MKCDSDRLLIISVCIVMIATMVFVFAAPTYRAFNPETLINYGNEEYIFALIIIGSGRSESIRAGTIKLSDYNKWSSGETGSIFLYSTVRPNAGWRLNTSSIVSITNYGSTPKWLPFNFV